MPDFTVDIWNEIFVIGWLLTAGGGLDVTMRWPKTGVYGRKTATRAEALFFGQSVNFILLSITRLPAQGSRVRTSNAMAKGGPSRPKPLTLRSLTALAHAHTKKANESVCCD